MTGYVTTVARHNVRVMSRRSSISVYTAYSSGYSRHQQPDRLLPQISKYRLSKHKYASVRVYVSTLKQKPPHL